ncbi:hypothetical protein BDR05DRAFT_895240 [Suillus weaverae]|nr:hypothetical protein BDR05DRAFT_895240 [Suillus weaverae]
MSLAKLPFMFAAATGFHIALTAPDIAEKDEVVVPNSVERFLSPINMLIAGFLKHTVWLVTAAEAAVILTPYIPPHSISPRIMSILGKLGSPDASKLTTASVFGSLMFMMSGYIRWECYRELGRFFTYKLSIREGHKLITTGPYSVVRHPSYMGMVLSFVGACALYGAPSSWLRVSGILRLPFVRRAAMAWASMMVVVVVGLFVRMPDEDKMMAQATGKEWEEWAKRVKYRVIPGIY